MRGQRLKAEPPAIRRDSHRHPRGFIEAGEHKSVISAGALGKSRGGTQPIAEPEIATHHRYLWVA